MKIGQSHQESETVLSTAMSVAPDADAENDISQSLPAQITLTINEFNPYLATKQLAANTNGEDPERARLPFREITNIP